MFLPPFEMGSGYLLIGVVTVGIALCLVLGGWASQRSANQHAKRLASTFYWLSTIPISLTILLLVLILVLSLALTVLVGLGGPAAVGM